MYFCFLRINVSEVHRMYQILEEEENIRFMTKLDATLQKSDTNATNNTAQYQISVPNAKTENQVLIKTETRTSYVNIDGMERDTVNEPKEDVNYNFDNSTDEASEAPENAWQESEPTDVDIDDIISLEPPEGDKKSLSTSKSAFKLLPKVLQDFLNNDWKSKSKCEPQRMIERIREEKRYPEHPDAGKYELLKTSAPSFLQRISLAGEFLNKKHLEL